MTGKLHHLATACGLLLTATGVLAAPQTGSDGGSSAAEAGATPAETTWYVDAELVPLLEMEASRAVSRFLQTRDELRIVNVTATIDMSTGTITADFGKGFLPGPHDVYAEWFLQELATTLRNHAERTGLLISHVDFLFQGKPLKHYYPVELAVPPRARVDQDNQEVLVSAGHGLIRVHPSQRWEYQRPDAFGYREDLITPAYGKALQQFIEARSRHRVHRARSRSQEMHPESSQPWDSMSSRYHLKALLPERGDLWNSLPTSTEGNREVNEDIRARPLYANDLNVGAMISLHTNGSESPATRGLEVFYHEDKPDDRLFAEKVLCGMRELIQAQPGYADFPARREASAGRHGENRIGTMPSIIVEIAYHSNAEDSAALQDPVFRAASMKGVEKGYRLFREGKVCAPFVLQPIADVALPAGTSRKITLPFDGNPQFPVTMEFTTASCSRPGACTPSKTTFTDPAVPVTVDMRCRGSLTGEARWSVVLRDTDGVVTAPVEFQQTCFKPASPPAA